MSVDKNKYPFSVCLNLTEEQYLALKDKSHNSGMTLSQFLRSIILLAPEKIENHEKNIKQLIYEINKIGVNLNQVVHAVNAGIVDARFEKTFLAYAEKLLNVLESWDVENGYK